MKSLGHNVALAAVVGLFLVPSPPVASQDRTFLISVVRHSAVQITDDEVDRILNAANSTNKGYRDPSSGNFVCPVRLVRDGPVRVAAPHEFPEVIRTESEFRKTLRVPGHVKIVRSIRWCMIEMNALACSSLAGPRIVATRYQPADLEPHIWRHELGHNRGLGDLSFPGRLMHETIGSDNWRLTQPECNNHIGPSPLTEESEDVLLIEFHDDESAERLVIEEFVARQLFHGTPYATALPYTDEEVARVLPLLDDDEAAESWLGTVMVAGMAGGESAVEPLLTFLFRDVSDDEVVTFHADRAKAEVPIALGHIVNRTGSGAGLEALFTIRNPEAFMRRASWPPIFEQLESFSQDVAINALEGLALAATPETVGEIVRLLEETSIEVERGHFHIQADPAWEEDLFARVIHKAEEVAEAGSLAEYYRRATR